MDIATGHASAQGPRQRNEDFAAVQRPGPGEEKLGWIAALADGVSGEAPTAGGGRMAAQTTVLALMRDWHGVPADWDTPAALERLIGAQNLWLAAHNRRNTQAALTTLSAVVLRGQGFTGAQVGDSRIWLIRDNAILQLTQDHALPQRDFARLTRAVGLEDSLHVDFIQGELRIGDRLLLTSDGVHGVLDARRLRDLALGDEDPQAAAEALVNAALAAGTHDNASAVLLLVRGLAEAGFDDVRAAAERLPTPGELIIGSLFDGMTLTAKVADNGVNRLHQARLPNGRLVAIKCLCATRAGDPAERAMLAHEGWLGQRLAGVEGFVAAHPVDPEASHFYLRFDWHAGRTMEQLLGTRPALPDVIEAARQLATALARLHRLGVAHRDIKPANLHLGDDGTWRVLDLGVALSGREPAAQRELHAGTPSYINPEQWDDPPRAADEGSDLFALGVSLYQWLTGHLPYGEVEPYQRGRYRRDPRAPSRLDARVPLWLDRLLLKAVALDPALRFETAEELLLAIERGAARPLAAQAATPLAQRDPLALWQIGLAMSVLLNALLIVWLLFLPR
ncbi:protein phosphatase 2C domain-containing protein [Pelomonas sp. KK5]|uniref:protein kinase domain-containing protein n=1 Tax=Pelomonas sp. KK5 TaxID=1855730 RepID=UPI003519CBCD